MSTEIPGVRLVSLYLRHLTGLAIYCFLQILFTVKMPSEFSEPFFKIVLFPYLFSWGSFHRIVITASVLTIERGYSRSFSLGSSHFVKITDLFGAKSRDDAGERQFSERNYILE